AEAATLRLASLTILEIPIHVFRARAGRSTEALSRSAAGRAGATGPLCRFAPLLLVRAFSVCRATPKIVVARIVAGVRLLHRIPVAVVLLPPPRPVVLVDIAVVSGIHVAVFRLPRGGVAVPGRNASGLPT